MIDNTTNILLVTVTKIETQAVFDVFEKATTKKRETQRLGGKTYYLLGRIGDSNVSLVQSDVGTSSPGGSLVTISTAIKQIRPSAIIMVGVAFGLAPNKQGLGDILVSRVIIPYEIGKAKKVILNREHINSSQSLLDLARSVNLDWKGQRVHFGSILSGDELINDLELRDQLIKQEPKAIGGEMEGSGLYIAASSEKVDWILIKSICDWADGKKSIEKANAQTVAARNAALFVLSMLQHMNGLSSNLSNKSPALKFDDADAGKSPPDLPGIATSEPPLSERSSEPFESISQFTIQDNALEKHAATDKPIQNVEQDRLGFRTYVSALHDFIVSQYTTTPLTISVDGPWGTGKSSLMSMLKNSLEPQNNIWERFVTWVKIIFQSLKWGWLWFWAFPVQISGRVLLRIILRFDKSTEEFDFRIGKNNSGFRSLITDIAQGFSVNPDLLKHKENELSPRVTYWAKVRARCESMEPVYHPTIWLNAWKFDNQEEVWASLALATLEQIKQKHDIIWMICFRIRLTFRRMSFLSALGVVLLQFALPVILGVIAFYYAVINDSFETPLRAFDALTSGYGSYLLWAGGILSGILTVTSVFKDPFQIPVDKIFDRPNYKDKVSFLTRFEKDFAKMVDLAISNGFGWKKSKLIIFIDDLDRCEPPKATDIVEAINLFLDAEGCVFVVGMDSESVAMSIEVKYKDLFDRMKTENTGVVSLGRAFLDKIVQIPFTVPRATSSQILNMVEETLGANLSKGITIAQTKEKPVDGVDQDLTKNQNKAPAPATQKEPTTDGAETDKERKEELDPASFAREEVRQAIRLGTELLSENPRQVKTFVNLFRLSIYIANARGFFEGKRMGDDFRVIGLDRLAIWVVCSVRWPNLIKHLHIETQTDTLRNFLNSTTKNIPSNYRWVEGARIPDGIKTDLTKLTESEKSSEAHWCHLPWNWWLLEPDFLKCLKLSEDLWEPPSENHIDWLEVLLTMTKPISQ